MRLWDTGSGACLRVLEGRTDKVISVCTLGDGRLASASEDKTVRVWDAGSGKWLKTISRKSPSAAQMMFSALSSSSLPPQLHCGRSLANFAPWSAPAVYLDAEVECVSLFTLGDRRIASAGLRNGQVHFFELVGPHPLPLVGGGRP